MSILVTDLSRSIIFWTNSKISLNFFFIIFHFNSEDLNTFYPSAVGTISYSWKCPIFFPLVANLLPNFLIPSFSVQLCTSWLVPPLSILISLFFTNWFNSKLLCEWGSFNCHLSLSPPSLCRPAAHSSFLPLYVKCSCSKLISQVSFLLVIW